MPQGSTKFVKNKLRIISGCASAIAPIAASSQQFPRPPCCTSAASILPSNNWALPFSCPSLLSTTSVALDQGIVASEQGLWQTQTIFAQQQQKKSRQGFGPLPSKLYPIDASFAGNHMSRYFGKTMPHLRISQQNFDSIMCRLVSKHGMT